MKTFLITTYLKNGSCASIDVLAESIDALADNQKELFTKNMEGSKSGLQINRTDKSVVIIPRENINFIEIKEA